jgi:hypothetical protein
MHLVLHIGTEKTGTTALQDWLYANRDALGGQRIYLSTSIGQNNNRDIVSFFRDDLDEWAKYKNIKTQEDKINYFLGFEEKFVQEVRLASARHDLMIITSEHFHSRLQARSEIARLWAFLTKIFESVRVCCYFREQSDMALSRYSTYLKGDHTLSLSDFLKDVTPRSTYYNFDRIAGLWSQAFGKEACDFRIYDRSTLLEGDIRKDFISAINRQVDLSSFDMSIAARNASLCEEEATLYRLINERVPYWLESEADYEPYNRFLKNLISEVDSSQRRSLSSQIRENVGARFAESNRSFFAKYINAEQAFSYKVEKPTSSKRHRDTDIGSEYVGKLISHAFELTTENRRLVTEIRLCQSENERLARIVAYYSRLYFRLALNRSGELRPWLRLALLDKDAQPRSFAKWLFYKKSGVVRKVFREALRR